MKTQEARERQAVVIGTALALFVAFLAAGGIVLVALRTATGRYLQWPVAWAVAAAGLLAGAYVLRHRR